MNFLLILIRHNTSEINNVLYFLLLKISNGSVKNEFGTCYPVRNIND